MHWLIHKSSLIVSMLIRGCYQFAIMLLKIILKLEIAYVLGFSILITE